MPNLSCQTPALPPDKLCPTAIRPCWPGAGHAIRALTRDIGEGVCASIVPGVQAHFIRHEFISTTRPIYVAVWGQWIKVRKLKACVVQGLNLAFGSHILMQHELPLKLKRFDLMHK